MLEQLLRFIDTFLMLGLGATYHKRFKMYADLQTDSGTPNAKAATAEWRLAQQREWDRLSLMLVLLATASAAMLAVGSSIPHPPFALWLAAAGLSICASFILTYFSIWALSIEDEHMAKLVQINTSFKSAELLPAMAIASPVVMALWSSVMFIVGIIVYAAQASYGRTIYKCVAIIPVGFGAVIAVGIIAFGETIAARIKSKPKPESAAAQRTHATVLPTHDTAANSKQNLADSEEIPLSTLEVPTLS